MSSNNDLEMFEWCNFHLTFWEIAETVFSSIFRTKYRTLRNRRDKRFFLLTSWGFVDYSYDEMRRLFDKH